MKAYIDYFDRLNFIVNQNYGSNDILVDLTHSNITPEYFAKIDERSDKILDFFDKEIANEEVRKVLAENITFERYNGNQDLMLCLLMDIIHYFEGLGHPTNLDSSEGVALLNILSKVYRPDYYMSYVGLSEVPGFIVDLDAMITYIISCIEVTDIMKTQSIISFLLQKIDHALDKEYRILLYRFCEAISEVDGVISVLEQESLRGLLCLNDKDLSNDMCEGSVL